MEIDIQDTAALLGLAAGKRAAVFIRQAIAANKCANIILATGTSQFETLKQLISEKDIDWGKVTLFHLDEYIHIPASHPASFRKYLKERFLNQVPALRAVHLIQGETSPEAECDRLGILIREAPVDVALVGIGENGHLAFNDPPADFETEKPYIIAQLDEACRNQQFGEGWFPTINDVPDQAISMSIHQIMLSKNIVCSVPDLRKAVAVRDCLKKEISNLHPASVLRNHPSCFLFLDRPAASLL